MTLASLCVVLKVPLHQSKRYGVYICLMSTGKMLRTRVPNFLTPPEVFREGQKVLGQFGVCFRFHEFVRLQRIACQDGWSCRMSRVFRLHLHLRPAFFRLWRISSHVPVLCLPHIPPPRSAHLLPPPPPSVHTLLTPSRIYSSSTMHIAAPRISPPPPVDS